MTHKYLVGFIPDDLGGHRVFQAHWKALVTNLLEIVIDAWCVIVLKKWLHHLGEMFG